MYRLKRTYLLFSTFLITTISTASAEWLQQESGVTDKLNNLFFLNADTGWVVGGNYRDRSIILRTNDGGEEWQVQDIRDSSELYSVFFINNDTGWVVGDKGILYTQNGGNQWTVQESIHTYIYDIKFASVDTGWAVGGEILSTINGGRTWTKEVDVEPLGHAMLTLDLVGQKLFCLGSGGIMYHKYLKDSIWTKSTGKLGNVIAPVDVSFISANEGWCVADAEVMAIVYSTIDAGSTWTPVDSIDWITCNGIDFISSKGWISGRHLMATGNEGYDWEEQVQAINGNKIQFIDSLTGWTVCDGGNIYHTIDGGKSGMGNQCIQSSFGNTVSITPNPFCASDDISIRIVDATIHDVMIYTLDGFSVECNIRKRESVYSVVVPGINKGIYLASIVTNAGLITKRIICRN